MSMLLLGCGGSSGAPTDILFITNSGGLALVTTPVPHGLSAGAFVSQSGTTGYDGVKYVSSVPSPTTYLTDDAYSADSTGGTWAASTGSAYLLGLSPSIWLKADAGVYSDAGTTPAVDTDTVRQWNDQSGNGRNVSQGTSAKRPTYVAAGKNGLPVLRFDGVDDLVSGASPTIPAASSLFLVASRDSSSVFFLSAANNTRAIYHTGNTVRWEVNAQQTTADATTGWRVFSLVTAATTAVAKKNGAAYISAGSVSPDAMGGVALGGSSVFGYGQCDISEFFAVHSTLSDAKVAALLAYANGRWAVY